MNRTLAGQCRSQSPGEVAGGAQLGRQGSNYRVYRIRLVSTDIRESVLAKRPLQISGCLESSERMRNWTPNGH